MTNANTKVSRLKPDDIIKALDSERTSSAGLRIKQAIHRHGQVLQKIALSEFNR